LPVGLRDVVIVNVEPLTDVTGPEIEPVTGDAAEATPASTNAAATAPAPEMSFRVCMCIRVQAAAKNGLRLA
jgi:hypothetical protein